MKARLTGLNVVTCDISQQPALICETIVSHHCNPSTSLLLYPPSPLSLTLSFSPRLRCAQVERLVEELQPFALNPLTDPTQPSLVPHLPWLLTPQLLSHTLNSTPIYLDDPSPVLLLTPPSTFTPLLTTSVDHTSPPSLAETLSPLPPLLSISPALPFTLPLTPFIPTPTVRCVGYRFVERRLGLGEEVLVIGRLVRERVGVGGEGREGGEGVER